MAIYARQAEDGPQYAPVFIHSFKYYKTAVVSPATTADKLKFYRNKKSLLQTDVADYVGIARSTYIDYENNSPQSYNFAHLGLTLHLLMTSECVCRARHWVLKGSKARRQK